MDIKQLVLEAHQTSNEKGWWATPPSFPESLALVHSELSEALEDYRNGRPVQQLYYQAKNEAGEWVDVAYVYLDGQVHRQSNDYDISSLKPCGPASELADVVIRVADLCGYYGIDLEQVLRLKMAYNRERLYRHGGKKL